MPTRRSWGLPGSGITLPGGLSTIDRPSPGGSCCVPAAVASPVAPGPGAWLGSCHRPPYPWIFLALPHGPCPHFTDGETEAAITRSLCGPHLLFPTQAGVAWPERVAGEGAATPAECTPVPPCPRLWQQEADGPVGKGSAAFRPQCMCPCEEGRAGSRQGCPLTRAWVRAETWRISLWLLSAPSSLSAFASVSPSAEWGCRRWWSLSTAVRTDGKHTSSQTAASIPIVLPHSIFVVRRSS